MLHASSPVNMHPVCLLTPTLLHSTSLSRTHSPSIINRPCLRGLVPLAVLSTCSAFPRRHPAALPLTVDCFRCHFAARRCPPHCLLPGIQDAPPPAPLSNRLSAPAADAASCTFFTAVLRSSADARYSDSGGSTSSLTSPRMICIVAQTTQHGGLAPAGSNAATRTTTAYGDAWCLVHPAAPLP